MMSIVKKEIERLRDKLINKKIVSRFLYYKKQKSVVMCVGGNREKQLVEIPMNFDSRNSK